MKLSKFILARIHDMWQNSGPVSTALLPLAWLTGWTVQARKRRAQNHPPALCPLPTIVVGNLMVGGTGKTPVVIAIVQHLQARGWTPGVVSRGYGATIKAEPRAGQGALDATQFGDEPALIAQATGAPVCVHPQRVWARKTLIQRFPTVDVIVSDDGLQHLALTRDIEIVVQDKRGLGNGRLLPAGPLREPAAKLSQVDFIINNGACLQLQQNTLDKLGVLGGALQQIAMCLQPTTAENLVTGKHLPWSEWLAQHATVPLAAVAAIGQPTRFFDMLIAAGLQPTNTVALPDHDAYLQSPFTTLNEEVIVITAKDAVKCRRFSDSRIWAIHVQAHFSDPAWLDRLTDQVRNTADEKIA